MADKKTVPQSPPAVVPGGGQSLDTTAEQFLKRWQSETGDAPPTLEAIQLALQALKQPSVAADTQAEAMSVERKHMHAPGACDICGHQNRPVNQFCGMCGLPLPQQPESGETALEVQSARSQSPDSTALSAPVSPASPVQAAPGHHFYHHHYHHHYFPAGVEGAGAAANGPRGTTIDATRDVSRAKVPGAPLTRTEAAVRKLLQDWAFACNTRHLEDLVGIYASDAILLRPNHPTVRGTAAIREFFVTALDAGFCDAELDPVRVEVFGDIAYEAGRCKALIPVAVSKRREERGKYLTLCARQSNGEWKIVADCWSSDLALSVGLEPETVRAPSAVVPTKPVFPRKNS